MERCFDGQMTIGYSLSAATASYTESSWTRNSPPEISLQANLDLALHPKTGYIGIFVHSTDVAAGTPAACEHALGYKSMITHAV